VEEGVRAGSCLSFRHAMLGPDPIRTAAPGWVPAWRCGQIKMRVAERERAHARGRIGSFSYGSLSRRTGALFLRLRAQQMARCFASA
jgi:hypothetical protein